MSSAGRHAAAVVSLDARRLRWSAACCCGRRCRRLRSVGWAGSRPCRGCCWCGERACRAGGRIAHCGWPASCSGWWRFTGCGCRIRLLYLGWLALSAYLAIYLPVFVGLSRVAVHRFGVPLWLAAPIVWTGLELARAHVLTGFLMASLAHTQVNWTHADSNQRSGRRIRRRFR